MLFSARELAALATPYPIRIRQNLQQKKPETALRLCHEFKDSQVRLHDFLAESCTVLWSFVGGELGESAIEAMFRYVFHHAANRQFFDAACADAPPHLAVKLLARSWRAHSCFGAGDHPGRFSITEDEEKFTFHLTPCGSGLRLWRKGWYEPGAAGRLSDSAHPWTYQRKRFPYYCIHCPFLNELLPYESQYGSLLWPVDPPESPDDNCAWHIYKDRRRIPDAYYDRLGIRKKPVPKSRYHDPGRRYFSTPELREMARPLPDRFIEHIETGDYPTAMRLCRQVRDEFLVLHDLYVNMLAATLTFISAHTGEAGLERALDRQFGESINRQFVEQLKTLPAKEKMVFMAGQVFGADGCSGAGRHGAKFSIAETGEAIVFRLSPCGSGGRLIRAGSYGPMPRLTSMREHIENRIIFSSLRSLPLPEALIEGTFPIIVNLFTQRKPFGQGKTGRAREWSFQKAGIPYYCCQCGMIAHKLENSGLHIQPPRHKKDPCTWVFDKRGL